MKLTPRSSCSGQTQGAALGPPRRPSPLLDKRRAHGGPPARVEQEDDDVAGVQDLRHPVQLPPDVRAREVRQEPEAGAAEEGLHRRAGEPPGHDEHGGRRGRQQQQQQPVQGRARPRAPGAAEHEAPQHRGRAAPPAAPVAAAPPAPAAVAPGAALQPLRVQLLHGLRDQLPHAGQHDTPAAPEREEPRPRPRPRPLRQAPLLGDRGRLQGEDQGGAAGRVRDCGDFLRRQARAGAAERAGLSC